MIKKQQTRTTTLASTKWSKTIFKQQIRAFVYFSHVSCSFLCLGHILITLSISLTCSLIVFICFSVCRYTVSSMAYEISMEPFFFVCAHACDIRFFFYIILLIWPFPLLHIYLFRCEIDFMRCIFSVSDRCFFLLFFREKTNKQDHVFAQWTKTIWIFGETCRIVGSCNFVFCLTRISG